MIKGSWNEGEGDIEDISIFYSVYYDCLVCANCSMSHSCTTVTFKNKLKALEHLREQKDAVS